MTENKPLLLITRPQKQSEQLLDDLIKRLGRVPRFIISPMIYIKELKASLPKKLINPFNFANLATLCPTQCTSPLWEVIFDKILTAF